MKTTTFLALGSSLVVTLFSALNAEAQIPLGNELYLNQQGGVSIGVAGAVLDNMNHQLNEQRKRDDEARKRREQDDEDRRRRNQEDDDRRRKRDPEESESPTSDRRRNAGATQQPQVEEKPVTEFDRYCGNLFGTYLQNIPNNEKMLVMAEEWIGRAREQKRLDEIDHQVKASGQRANSFIERIRLDSKYPSADCFSIAPRYGAELRRMGIMKPMIYERKWAPLAYAAVVQSGLLFLFFPESSFTLEIRTGKLTTYDRETKTWIDADPRARRSIDIYANDILNQLNVAEKDRLQGLRDSKLKQPRRNRR